MCLLCRGFRGGLVRIRLGPRGVWLRGEIVVVVVDDFDAVVDAVVGRCHCCRMGLCRDCDRRQILL